MLYSIVSFDTKSVAEAHVQIIKKHVCDNDIHIVFQSFNMIDKELCYQIVGSNISLEWYMKTYQTVIPFPF